MEGEEETRIDVEDGADEDAESWKQSAEASAEEEDLQKIWRC